MTVTLALGFESQAVSVEGAQGAGGFALNGAAAFSTLQARTGTVSVRCNPASGGVGYASVGGAISTWVHVGMYIASLPTLDRAVIGAVGAGVSAKLTSAGALGVYDQSGTLVGTSSPLSTGAWHWIGLRNATGTSVVFLQVDGVDSVTGTVAAVNGNPGSLGFFNTEASAADVYFDDFIVDNAGFLAPSKVALLVPTADSARGTGWTGGAGGISNLNNAVDNTPPVGVVDPGTDASQIHNGTSNANVNYDATMTTYTAAGVGAADTVLAVIPIIATAAPVSTSAKQGTVGVVSNPTIANIALGSGGTAGAFWSGVAGGTYPTGWKVSQGTFTTAPSVTVGTAPVMRVTQVTSSTRVAMVCFMGMYVAWTPAAVVADNPPPYVGGGYYGFREYAERAAKRFFRPGWARQPSGLMVPA